MKRVALDSIYTRKLGKSWDNHKLPNCIVLGGNGSTNYSLVSGAAELLHKKATFIKRLTLSLYYKGHDNR
jgi:hypothetical protein